MENETVPRVGSFFLLVGTVLMMLFIGSIIGREVNPIYFLFSAAAITLGIFFRRSHAPRPPSTRFHTVRKVREYGRTRREQIAAKKKDQKNDQQKDQKK